MALISAMPTLVIALISPWMFPQLFGSEWKLAGEIGRLLAPLMFVSLVVGPVNMVILIAGRQKVQISWELARTVALIFSWGIITRFELDLRIALVIYVATSVFMSALYLFLAYRILGKSSIYSAH